MCRRHVAATVAAAVADAICLTLANGLGLACHGTVLDSVGKIAPSVVADRAVVFAEDGTGDFAIIRAQRVALINFRGVSVRLAKPAKTQLRS